MQPIEKILFQEPRGVLSLTGGCGKTSLMYHLAHLLVRSGKRVLTTTTTKLFVPTPEQSRTLLVDADPEVILLQASSCLHNTSHITAAAAQMVDSGKLHGSARRPLKAPAEHEPVIPPDTSVLVAVAGLEVLGDPLSEELVFRSALAGTLMGLARGKTITESALASLFAHPFGSFKGSPPQARRFIFLNKADDPAHCAAGARVAAQLRRLAHPTAEALIVGQALDRIRVHAVHNLAVTV